MKDPLKAAEVTVIVPTLASSQRSASLRRAIESIRASSVSPINIIAVVNGNDFDQANCDWLKMQPDVQLEYSAAPSAPGARLLGRKCVVTEYFSTLDDDDEMLPGATDQKLATLRAEREADLLVSYWNLTSNGIERQCILEFELVLQDPLQALMRFNWLASGNALFRTASIVPSYFEDFNDMTEWTWVAFQLALDNKRVAVLKLPTFRYNESPNSLSKSPAFFDSSIPLLRRMLSCEPPLNIVRLIQRKIGQAHHDAADAALKAGRRRDAWWHHLQSVVSKGGLKYWAFTRHFFK